MALAAGTSLGPYQILSPLGAGGMGEVYRAKDARLNRTVAIKVLSDESAADADRRERFEREAKAISALDHPHICALYDVGEHEGTYFLVMPCLEGQPLADRIAKGALPLDQTIKYAIEIALALDAAHRHGIIHRDLKPGNIMLTKTGVKLLDFGLAKLKKTAGPLTYSGMAQLAGETTQATGTGVGTLLGTMPYMAPEQVEGRDVDARSDIFSLGAVIYEMVTGQRAFKGDSPASVIGAILKDEPTPIKTLQPLTPAAFDHIVTTCLAKDPDERWQSAADIARELKWIAQRTSTPTATPTTSRVRMFGAGAAAAAIVALGLAAIAWPSRPVAAPENVIHFVFTPPDQGAFVPSRSSIGILQIAVSPNGRRIAFVASRDDGRARLWVRGIDDVTAKELGDSVGASDPFWSPDSQHVGFFAAGRLKSVDVVTAAVRDICAASSSSRGGAWSPLGVIVFGADSLSGLSRVSTSTGTIEPATEVTDTATSHRWPSFLPDGRHFLYLARGEENTRGIYVASLDGGAPTRVLDSVFNGIHASGHLLTVQGGTLLAYPFDERTFKVTGDPLMVAERLGGSSTQRAAFSVSSTGVLVYARGINSITSLAWFDRSGRAMQEAQTGNFVNYRLSPDESQVAFSRIDPSTNTSDVWLMDVTRPTSTRLTLHPMNDLGPVWSPDGQRLVFRSDRSGGNHLFQKPSNSGANDVLIVKREVSNPTDWSPDGRYVVFHNTAPKSGLDLSVVQLENSTITPIAQTPFDEYDGRFSPDGRWLAYVSEESGSPEVYVQPFPPTGAKFTMSAGGGGEPRWRRDGRELFYLATDRKLMSVDVDGRGPFRARAPRPLFETSVPSGPTPYRTYLEASGDGQRFLLSSAANIVNDPPPITVVVNWLADARRR